MAVDTRLKRGSILGLAFAAGLVLPAPDTSVDAGDRVRVAFSYAGTDFSGVAGTATSDLNALAQSAAGTYGPTGTATSDLNQLAQSAAGYTNVTGTATSNLNALSQSAAGIGGEVADTAATGGGSGAKKRKKPQRKTYPRRVYVDGKLYTVRTPEEERELLRQWRDTLQARQEALVSQEAPPAVVKKAKVKVVKAQRRIDRVDTREDEWLAKLQEEDDEILMAVLH